MGNLYYVENAQHIDNIITADVTLNFDHPIFKGHYPDQPVLPGACILQLVKDVLASSLKMDLVLVKAFQIKFLQMVAPQENQTLHLKITYNFEEENLKLTAALSNGDTICFKFQGNFS